MANANLHVDIVSAEGHIHHGEATMVFAPASLGEIGIAPRHAPLLTTMKPGPLRVQQANGEELSFFVNGGILEVQPHLVTVLADTAVRAKDVDENAALAAKQAAEAALGKAQGKMDLAKAQADLVEAAARYEYVQHLKKTSTR